MRSLSHLILHFFGFDASIPNVKPKSPSFNEALLWAQHFFTSKAASSLPLKVIVIWLEHRSIPVPIVPSSKSVIRALTGKLDARLVLGGRTKDRMTFEALPNHLADFVLF